MAAARCAESCLSPTAGRGTSLVGRYGVAVAGSLVDAGDVAAGVGDAAAVGVGVGVAVGDGAALVGGGVVGAGVVGAGVVGAGVVGAGAVAAGVVAAGAVVAGGGTSLGRAVRPGTDPTPWGVPRWTARGWVAPCVEVAADGAADVVVAGAVRLLIGSSVIGSTGTRGMARDTSSVVRTGVCCGSSPPPAVTRAMLKPEPERMTAVRTRNASLRPGSSRR